jgi:hypothetical protein
MIRLGKRVPHAPHWEEPLEVSFPRLDMTDQLVRGSPPTVADPADGCMGLPTRSTSAEINKPRIGVIRQGRGPTSVALPTEALAAQRKERNHVCRHDRKPAGPAAIRLFTMARDR